MPLIIQLPGGQHAGSRLRTPVRLIDIMPTVLDVMGVAAGTDQMQGLSLRPV